MDTTCKHCGAALKRYPTKSGMTFCDVKCKAEWQKLQRPVSVDWLIGKYIGERLDCTAIAKLVGRDAKSVWNWLKGSGIETRKRGTTGNYRFATPRSGWRHSEEAKRHLSAVKKASGSCPAMINGVHWMKVYPSRKPATWKGGISPERQAVYGTTEWKNAAKEVWRRDKATCQRCLCRKSDFRILPFDIHHIESFASRDNRCSVDNLVLLCEPCHYFIHSNRNTTKLFLK